ncbi:MAG: DUF11 domain-containing protein [Pedobacter sp.]|uniref:DUF11 domain-containing protein n=1 Tax=Pedobacter sp. TaxID=1411316 RepID=UPI00280A1565|nr:DUF11 domain-containing protein [Pedobacter sp.]MDQ8006600.1 DUF11 domain-containing protein [Pedobacter sp.]
MKYYLYTILFLVFGLSITNAQTPTLLHSQAYSASGVGGVPTVSVNIPAGKNRLMLVSVFMERNHGGTPNSNWPFDPDNTPMENTSSFSAINVNGIACAYLDGRSNNHASPSGSTRFSHHYLVRYLNDVDGLPTGPATVSFPNLNLPENAGDEMVVVIAIFANAKQTPTAVNSNRERAYTSSNLTVTGTSPTPDAPQTGIPTAPLGNAATDIVYLSNAMLSQQGTVLATPSGWTSVQSVNVNNNLGTAISTVSADNEQDGVRFLSAYRSGVSNPSFTVTRTGTVRIDRAAAFLYGILPLVKPGVYGTVYRDNNGSTTIDGGGTGGGVWTTANTLYVNAVGVDGNVVATATVNTSGVFQFPQGGNLIEGDLIRFQLSRNQGTVGQPAPIKELPSGWATVGESSTSGASDGSPNGEFTLTIGTSTSANNTTNRFGVTSSTDIQVNKSGPLSVASNGSITYKIYVTNNGPGLATNVVVTDPAVSNFTATGITCEAGTGSGGSASCPASVTVAGIQGTGLIIPSLPDGSAVVFTITGNASASGTITNTASATAALDTNPSNNSSTVITRIENNVSCLQSTYTLNLAQTVANNTVAVNGGTLNLYYTRTSGTAVPGVAEPLIIPVTYSDLNNRNGIDNQWREIRIEDGNLMLGVNTTDGGTGSVYNSLPLLNRRASPSTTYYSYPFSGNVALDRAYTEFLRNGELEQLGTFTLGIGLPSVLPTGVKILAEVFEVQGKMAANLSGNELYSGYGVKPLIQHTPAFATPAATSFTLDSEFELGQSYVWKYLAYRASGRGITENHRGVVFKSTNTITLTYNCCEAGTAAPTMNPATNYSNINSSYNIPCGVTTANLTGLTASNKPTLTTLTWHTATPATNTNKITNVTALTGTTKYYAAFYDSVNGCYSPTKEVTVYAAICAADDNYSTTPIIAGVGGTLPSIFSNDTYNGATITTATSGNISFNYSVWTTSIAEVDPATGVVTVLATTPPGTYTYTYEIRDTDPDAVSGSNVSFASVTFRVVSCTNPPATGTPDGYTQTGISNLLGFANRWPKNVPNGFIAIESKNKGFVITRIQNVNLIPVAQRVEGMLVYDIDAACIKLYNGTMWKCIEKNCDIN